MTRNDRLSIGPSIPGFALRLLAVLIGVGAGMLLDMPFGWIAVLCAAAVIGGGFPQMGGIWIAAGIIAVHPLLQDQDLARTAIVVLAVHLLHVLASIALVVPLRARVALRALLPTVIRVVVIQVICQAVALAVFLVPRGAPVSFAVLAGAGAVLLLVVAAGRMLRRERLAAFSRQDAQGSGRAGQGAMDGASLDAMR